MSDLLKCPHCSVLIAPSDNGKCPVCDRFIAEPIADSADAPYTLPVPVRIQPSAGSQSAQFWAALNASTPRFWVTPTLIVVNVAIFVAMLVTSRTISPPVATVLDWGANFGPKTLHGEWWRLFAAMFLHFNLLHIGFNMWALANLGQLVERLVGNLGFLLLYLVSGLCGCIVSVAWNPEVVGAGASGAVFGVGGALLGFLLLRRNSIPAPVLVPLRNSMFTFIGYNVVFGFVVPGIDNAAHLGGLAAGIGCGLLLSHPLSQVGVSRRWLRNAILLVAGVVVPAGVFWLLPEPPADFQAERRRLSEMEQRLGTQYNDLIRRSRDKTLSDAEFAGEVENKLLPELTAAKTRFGSLRISPSHRNVADLYGKYLQLREDSWRSLVIWLREDSQAALIRSQEQSAAANRLAKQIGETAD